ncbi:MAG: hypothetical protein DRO76_04395 [Candidatus Altiarchaeales archaeon]|nr:MAG: hypothetical protein DRO76_04395 [Candidatus Altiarchaeales archaeon]
MKITKIISNWFNILRRPDETLSEIEDIDVSDGIKSLILGYCMPVGIVTLIILFIVLMLLLLGGISSFEKDIPISGFLAGGAGLLMLVIGYIAIILGIFLIILIFFTIFAGVVRLLCRFTGGEGSFRKDLGIIYFLGGGLVGIFGVMYLLFISLFFVSMIIPILGIILVILLYCVFLLSATFISGSYSGALFDLLSRIEKKSLTRIGGIVGVAYGLALMVIYLIFIAIYILFIVVFFASILGMAAHSIGIG